MEVSDRCELAYCALIQGYLRGRNDSVGTEGIERGAVTPCVVANGGKECRNVGDTTAEKHHAVNDGARLTDAFVSYFPHNLLHGIERFYLPKAALIHDLGHVGHLDPGPELHGIPMPGIAGQGLAHGGVKFAAHLRIHNCGRGKFKE